MTLSPHQFAAVTANDTRLVLRAGAGSGKTRVLVERVARLIEGGYHPAEILCLTFTRAAAAEMRERLRARLPQRRGLHRLAITTFHAWACRIIREFHDLAGYAREFTVRDEDDREDLVKWIGVELGLKWKSEKRLWQEESVRRRYRDILREVQAVDFDGLEHELGHLLERPDVAAQLRRRWAHVLVDETQDNSPGQWATLALLAPGNGFVVGDHAQSIYGFRGASPAGFVELGDEGRPEAWKVLTLPDNYRSHPDIVEEANAVASIMDPPGIEMVAHRLAEGEAAVACLPWAELAADVDAHDQADCAILAPTWRLAELAAETLTAAGIPVRLARPIPDVWDSGEMRWLMLCLRAAANHSDHVSLRQALNGYALRIGVGDWSAMRARALSDGSSCLDVLRELRPAGCSWLVEAIAKCAVDRDIDELRIALAQELGRLHLDTRAAYMSGAVDDALATRNGQDDGSSTDLLDWYATRHLDAEPTEESDDEPAVTVGTIHSSKGLEWPYVWVLDGGMCTRWPGRDYQESLRLRYVATTRARDRLRLVSLPAASVDEGGES